MLILITIFMGVLYLYTLWRGIFSLTLPLFIRGGLSLFLLLGVFNIYVVLKYGYLMPPILSKMFSVSHLWLIYLVLSTVVLDVLRLCHIQSSVLEVGVVFGTLLLSILAVHNAGKLPVLKEMSIESQTLPMGWQDLKIVHVSDFHIGQGFNKAWLQKVVDKINAQSPDIVVISGDSIDNRVEKLLDEMAPLKQIKTPVYMSFGNHEHYYDPKEWEKAFRKMGIVVLNNTFVSLENKGMPYVMAGADWGRRMTPEDKVGEALKTAPKNTPILLSAHHPAAFDFAVKHHVLLTLSGHTHGGMTFPISVLTKMFNRGYLKGLYTKKDSFLIVSEGTGLWNGMPARLGSQNEILVITLKRKSK